MGEGEIFQVRHGDFPMKSCDCFHEKWITIAIYSEFSYEQWPFIVSFPIIYGVSSGYVKITMENDHRNSEFSQLENGD